jgi:hypothetical protein
MSIAREKAEIRHSTESRKQRAECRLDLLLHFEGRFEQILMDGARIFRTETEIAEALAKERPFQRSEQ